MDLGRQQDVGAFVSSCFLPCKLPSLPATAMTSKAQSFDMCLEWRNVRRDPSVP